MGDTLNLDDPASFSRLPGSLFYPSEQQLICYYLTSKIGGTHVYGADVIKDLDFHNLDPFSLPESACFRFGKEGQRRHWYFYVVLRDRGRRRAAGSGYWRKKGGTKNVVNWGEGKGVVGKRNCFVFYSGSSEKIAVRTPWVMYEYALVDHHVMSFVLCRVFFKCKRSTNLSEHVINACGVEMITSIRPFGVQCDTQDTSTVVVTTVHDNNSEDDDLKGHDVALDPQTSHEPAHNQENLAILEDDFIELDDLLPPLPEND